MSLTIDTPLIVGRWLRPLVAVPSSPDVSSSWARTDNLYITPWEAAAGGAWSAAGACLTVAPSSIRGWQLRSDHLASSLRFRAFHSTHSDGLSPWRRIWHQGDQGAGTGMDADLVDGQHGSYYRNASNLDAGTVPLARLGTNSPSSGMFLSWDGSWQTPASGGVSSYIANVPPDGSNTVLGITHGLGSTQVMVQFIHKAGTGLNSGSNDIIYGPQTLYSPAVEIEDEDELILTFPFAPVTNEWTIIVVKP